MDNLAPVSITLHTSGDDAFSRHSRRIEQRHWIYHPHFEEAAEHAMLREHPAVVSGLCRSYQGTSTATHRHEPALELKEPTSIEIFLIRAVRYLLPRFFPPIVQDQIRISDTCLQSESISYFCLLMNTSKTTATTIFGSKNISDSKGLVWASPYSRCGPLTCHKVRLICEEPRF